MSVFLCGRLKPSVIYSTHFSCYSHACVIRDQTPRSVTSCSGQSQWNNLAQFSKTYCWKLLTSRTYYLINNTRSYRDKYFLSISQSSIHLNTQEKSTLASLPLPLLEKKSLAHRNILIDGGGKGLRTDDSRLEIRVAISNKIQVITFRRNKYMACTCYNRNKLEKTVLLK